MQQKQKLRLAIAKAVGLVGIVGFSSQAVAVSLTNLGDISAGSSQTVNSAAPIKAWTDYGTSKNYGWTHTAKFYSFQVGAGAGAEDRFDVNIQVQGTGTTPLMPGFSVWTSGNQALENPTANGGYGHSWSQVRGPYDGGFAENPCGFGDCNLGSNGWMASGASGNIIAGHDGWIGFANAGYSFENGDFDLIPGLYAGGTNQLNESKYWNSALNQYETLTNVNDSSPWVNGGSASLAPNNAILSLLGLKAGYYMIGLGGVCPDNDVNGQNCAAGGAGNFQLTVANLGAAASAVPVPAAAWLFGGAMVSLVGANRRKRTLPV